MTKVLASVLAADFLRLQEDVTRVLRAGADGLHLDIMDGHFVPNLSFGPDVVKALSGAFPTVLMDVHLMLQEPLYYMDIFAAAGAHAITVHAETGEEAWRCIPRAKALGLKAGISLRPDTPPEQYKELILSCDQVLLMTVEPGFGGQRMNAEVLFKAGKLRDMGFEGPILADGGINVRTAPLAVEAGVGWLVMGTALFRDSNPGALLRRLHDQKPQEAG